MDGRFVLKTADNINRGRAARIFLGVIATLAITTAAFAQSAARVGLAIPVFSSLGPAFFEWRAQHLRHEQVLIRRPAIANARSVARSARQVVATEPLAISAWRGIGLAAASTESMPAARAVMVAASALSRRDAATQAWLIDDGIRRQQVGATLRHFDALMRTEPEAREPLLGRLAMVLENASARRDLAAYVRGDNSWFGAFNAQAANRRGSVIPYAQLLLSAARIPDAQHYREGYGEVVSRLVREGQFDLLRRLFPRLPGAEPTMMTRLSLSDTDNPPYPPVGWVLMDEADRGSTLVASSGGDNSVAMEAFADPIAGGIVARRLFWPPSDARTISWRIVERDGARDASGVVRLRCLDAVVQSANLFVRGSAQSLAIPPTCPVAMLELSIFGGTGRDPATLVLDRVTLGSTRTVEGVEQ